MRTMLMKMVGNWARIMLLELNAHNEICVGSGIVGQYFLYLAVLKGFCCTFSRTQDVSGKSAELR
jgi:hypothetical protein